VPGLFVALGGLGLLLGALPLAAQSGKGALPKGDVSEIDAGKAAAGKTARKRRNCFLDLTDPPGGNGVYTPDGKHLYLLAPTAAAPSKGKEPASVTLTLFKIDPKARKSEPVLKIDQRVAASLVLHHDGKDIGAVTAIAFLGRTSGCFEGTAGLVSVPLSTKDAPPVKSSGSFQLVHGPLGKQLVDMGRQSIVALDTTNFQSKVLRKVPAGERALYFDGATRRLVTWHDSAKGRGIVEYTDPSNEPTRRLAVRVGDRVLQSGGQFGVAKMDLKTNTIELQELAAWSGGDKASKHKINVPAAYTVTSAGMDVHFGKRLALVYGANFLAKQRWQRVFVFDYTKKEPLGAVPVTGNQYLNYAGIDPTGQYAVVEVRDLSSRLTVGAKIFDVTKNKFDDVDLGIQKGPKK
jgi:hypothetical protein